MMGHRSFFQEIDDLLPWRGPAVKKKPRFSNARALITRTKYMPPSPRYFMQVPSKKKEKNDK